MSRTRYDADGDPSAEIAWLDCATMTEDPSKLCVQDVDFFDDDELVVLYTTQTQQSGERYRVQDGMV